METIIYIPYAGYDYEGENIYGAYSSYEAAFKSLRSSIVHLFDPGEGVITGDYWGISAWNLDGEFIQCYTTITREDLLGSP